MDAVTPLAARDASRRARGVFDVCTIGLLVAVALPGLLRGDRTAVSAVLSAALIGPLILRRQHPVGVFAATAVIAMVQWSLGPRLFADVSLLVALYSVAAFAPRRWSVAALGVLEAGCLLAVLRWSPHPGFLLAFVLLSGMAAAALALGLYTGTRRVYLLSLQERAARLELERDQQGELAAAAERARIAREMHDIVAHHLTVMVAVSDGAVAAAVTSPEASMQAMRTVSSVGREALRDTRRLLGVLREDADQAVDFRTPLPGLTDLDDLVEQVRSTGLDVVLSIEGEPAELPSGLPLTVYRLVQEALTNTMKHASEPTRARVRLSHLPHAILVEVSDDGLPAQDWQAGHGVTGMRERVHAWGGELKAGPLTPQGWRIQATLPLEPTVARMVGS